jgi:DNA polymerase-1
MAAADHEGQDRRKPARRAGALPLNRELVTIRTDVALDASPPRCPARAATPELTELYARYGFNQALKELGRRRRAVPAEPARRWHCGHGFARRQARRPPPARGSGTVRAG